jgi:hypothetical protein
MPPQDLGSFDPTLPAYEQFTEVMALPFHPPQ